MEDLTGKQLSSYQIVAPLGEGGMAAVYKAYQPGMDRYVALKILPRHFASDPQFVARFEQEAKVLAKLQHPHILPVFDYGEADGYTYIAMPFLQSGDLTDLLKGQPLSLAQTGRIISQIGDALDYAHSRGLVHRDVKPSNVLLDERGNCLLTDFGIAKIVESSSKLTVTGGIIGTPAYMSPEQGLAQKLDGRSDIYSLGIMLYELATGRVPYQAETPMAVVIKHMNDPLPPPRKVNLALPEAVERVILKALAKQPENRYATAGEMVRALRAAIAEVGSPSQTLSDGDTATITATAGTTLDARSPKTVSTRKWILAAGSLAIVVLVGAIVFFAFGSKQKIEPEATLIQQTEATTEITDVTIAATEQAGISHTVSPTTPVETKATNAPVTHSPTDPTIYDDFNDQAYDGTINKTIWLVDLPDQCDIVQQDGVLIFKTPIQTDDIGCDPIVGRPTSASVNDLGIFEAKLQIANDHNGKSVNQGIQWQTIDYPVGWYAFCGLGAFDDGSTGIYFDVTNMKDNYQEINEGISAEFNHWYTVRLEIDPDSFMISCLVDDKLLGSIVPKDTSELRKARFQQVLAVARPPGAFATGYVDEVRIMSPTKTTASGSTTITYLADIHPREISTAGDNYCIGYDPQPVGDTVSCGTVPIILQGQQYSKSLFAHANSTLIFDLDGKYDSFVTSIFLYGSACGDGATFRIELDGKEIYASPVVKHGDLPHDIRLDVSGGYVLRLETFNGESGDWKCDGTVWGEPYLTSTSAGTSIGPGTVLFEEDFENDKFQGIGFSAELGWKIATDETGNKVYEIDNRNGPNYKGFSFGMPEWKDYSVEYRARFLNSTGKQSEIGSHYRSDGNSSYVLVFSEAELYLAYQESEWIRLTTQFPHIERNVWYNVKADVQGEQISVYLDNILLANAKSSEIQQGEVMIFVGPDTYAQIDDIRVAALGE